MVLVHPAAPPHAEALDTQKHNTQETHHIKDAAKHADECLCFTPAATISPSFPHDAEKRLTWATWNGREATKKVVSKATALAMLEALEALVKHEPTLVEVGCGWWTALDVALNVQCIHDDTNTQVMPAPGSKVTVVGDTHGHFHDVCSMYVSHGVV